MDIIFKELVNSVGQYDLGSIVKLFTYMIAFDGIIGVIYAVIKGFHGK